MQNRNAQFIELITTLSSVLDLDENIKLYHAWRTALVAYKLAQTVIPEDAEQIFFAGLLHDVGAIGLEDHIVHYPEASYNEHEIILNHPIRGAAVVAEIPGLKKAATFILDHHETYDGTGYPRQIAGEELNIGSQILYIADHLDLLLRNDTLDRTDIYNFFRLRKGHKFTLELWPAVLDLLHANGGTYLHMLREKHGYLQLMHEAIKAVGQADLELGDDFLDQVIKVFGKVIDAKHSYTQGHTERVVAYSTVLANALGLTAEEVKIIQRGAYLHDIGKLGVPLSILDKREPLNDEEFYKIKRHILITMEVLDSMSFLRDLTEVSGYHHARWDGRGYPDKIQGEDIPLGARIICIGDSFDAMTSNRAYRNAFDFDRAWSELKKNGGSQFDPGLIVLLEKSGVKDGFMWVYQTQFTEKIAG